MDVRGKQLNRGAPRVALLGLMLVATPVMAVTQQGHERERRPNFLTYLEHLRQELAEAQSEYIELLAELHVLAARMVALHADMHECIAQMRRCESKKEYMMLHGELEAILAEWSTCRSTQAAMVQRVVYLVQYMEELRDEISRQIETWIDESG